jgi:DNA polymerase III sliding clamp (beta) subunit (PCNA family)
MTLTLNSTAIRRANTLFRRLKIRHSTLPILTHVRITVAPGDPDATLEVSNLDIGIAMRLPFGGPTTPGAFTLAQGDLASIARSADRDTPVLFEREEIPPAPTPDDVDFVPVPDSPPAADNAEAAPPAPAAPRRQPKVHVTLFTKSMRTKLTLESLDPAQFPDPPAITGPPVIMPNAALAAIRRVRPCASLDETRYVLNGVFITRHAGGAAVATDGRRMAILEPAPFATPDAILPNLLVDLLFDAACQTAALWRNDEDAEIASLQFGPTTLFFRLISGNYPNFRQVIPDPASRTGSCTFADATLSALATWLRNYPGETIGLTFDPPASTVTFEVFRRDQGRYSTSASAAFNGTPPAACAYNASFLADALAMNLHTMDLIDEMSPAVLTDGLTRYVLMPMRLMKDAAAYPEPAAAEPAPEPEEDAPADHTEPAGDAIDIAV